MKVQNILCLVILLLVLVALPAAADRPAKPEVPVSTAAFVSPAGPPKGPLDVTDLSTDFEAAEGAPPGFAPGYCAQNGWTAFTDSTVEGQISAANPYNGAQHLRVAKDPALPENTNVGCFSPDIGPKPVQPNSLSIYVAISADGGADYFVVGQAPSQGLATAYFRFFYLGDIVVADDLGAGAVWVDTGADWTVGPYVRVDMVVDPGANTIRYYYGGALIYTGVAWAGTTIEQVVLFSDNWNVGDVGDFDTLQVQHDPTSISLASFESRPAAAWFPWAGLAGLGLVAGVGLAVSRRRRS